jgi:hypothetical protein
MVVIAISSVSSLDLAAAVAIVRNGLYAFKGIARGLSKEVRATGVVEAALTSLRAHTLVANDIIYLSYRFLVESVVK